MMELTILEERRLAGKLVKWGKSLYDNDQFGFIATK